MFRHILESRHQFLYAPLFRCVERVVMEFTYKDDQCAVCFESTINITSCGHIICEECICSWQKESNSCPVCRHTLDASRVIDDMDEFLPFLVFWDEMQEQHRQRWTRRLRRVVRHVSYLGYVSYLGLQSRYRRGLPRNRQSSS